jgi:hypothetical protein
MVSQRRVRGVGVWDQVDRGVGVVVPLRMDFGARGEVRACVRVVGMEDRGISMSIEVDLAGLLRAGVSADEERVETILATWS